MYAKACFFTSAFPSGEAIIYLIPNHAKIITATAYPTTWNTPRIAPALFVNPELKLVSVPSIAVGNASALTTPEMLTIHIIAATTN